ncbi:MAG TPA: hypothetical protein VFE24_18295 [Pirellulales bacterium]|jgi:hypothetical protein|nr:hypothetical protein [Pirellulales bacterium]
MADLMRWRYGETNPVILPVDGSTAIAIGDLLYWSTNQVLPAAASGNHTNEAGNQAYLHAHFAGVAMQRSRVGDTQPIRVATTGVFEFDSPSATYEVGDLIGGCNAASGTALENQKVKGVGAVASAIGRCAKRVAAADTRVLVDVVASLSQGGPQAVA